MARVGVPCVGVVFAAPKGLLMSTSEGYMCATREGVISRNGERICYRVFDLRDPDVAYCVLGLIDFGGLLDARDLGEGLSGWYCFPGVQFWVWVTARIYGTKVLVTRHEGRELRSGVS